jgi:hypothetical protein
MPIINAEGCQLETSYQSLLPIVPSVSCKPASSDDRLRLTSLSSSLRVRFK